MSICIKGLNDYDMAKKCRKYGIVKLKSNFHKDSKGKDGLFSQCKSSVIQKQKYMILRIERKL